MKRLPCITLIIVAFFTMHHSLAQNSSPYWSLAGNSNASGSSKLGTTSSIPLRFFTKNAERLRIDTLGKVGIGLTTLKGKLNVQNGGSIPVGSWVSVMPVFAGFSENTVGSADYVLAMASNTSNARSVLLGKRSRGTLATPTRVSSNDLLVSMMAAGFDGSAFQYPASLDFLVDGTTTAGAVPTRISFITGSNATNRAERLRIFSNGNISFNTNQLFVQKATGNVGIGTSSPAYKLQVVGTGGISTDNNANTTDAAGLRANGSGYGVYATSDGILDTDNGFVLGGKAVFGKANGNYGTGVQGEAPDPSGTGVAGIAVSEDGTGVAGSAYEQGGIGINGSSVYSYGVYGSTANNTSYAGYFAGDVFTTGTYLPSAAKLKQNVKDLSSATDLIAKLHPKEYEYKQEGSYMLMRLPEGKRYGLIAEELEQVLPTIVKQTFFDTRLAVSLKPQSRNTQLQKAESEHTEKIDFKAIDYIELIPIVIKGMQELREKDSEIDALKAEVDELRRMVLELKDRSTNVPTATSTYLEQNKPNPVSGTTTIRYHLPAIVVSAALVLTNAKGQLVKTVTLRARGSGQVSLDTSMLASGAYNYSLYVDGNAVDTKRFIIAR